VVSSWGRGVGGADPTDAPVPRACGWLEPRRCAITTATAISDKVAAGPITDAGTRAPDMLEDLDEALNAKGISLVFAAIEDPVRGIKR
jgi:hypothetical protein